MSQPPDSDLCNLIIACVGSRELDENIINSAYKKARTLNVPWKILHIRHSAGLAAPFKKKPISISKLTKRAQMLGAEIDYIDSPDAVNAITNYAINLPKGSNPLFMVGMSPLAKLPLLNRRTIYNNLRNELVKHNIKIEAVKTEQNKKYALILPLLNFGEVLGMIESVAFVLIATLLCIAFDYTISKNSSFIQNGNIYLIYLVACVAAAVRGGMITGLIAMAVSIVAIYYFFPSGSLHDPVYAANILIFAGTAIIISLICSGTRRYLIEAKQKEAYLNALLNISENLNRPLSVAEALSYIYNELKKLFHAEVLFFGRQLMDGKSLVLKYPETMEKFKEVDEQALEKCHNEFISTGFLTPHLPQATWYFEPMMSSNGFQGVLAVKLAESSLKYDSNITGILLSFADLSATIIDRIESTQVIEDTKIQQEKEKLRTMLLSSVSHDLKTPLASIIGSLDVYHSLYEKLTDENRRSLTETAYQEAQRLDSFIVNILDMAKLESGSIKFQKEWQQPRVLFEKVLLHVQPKLGKRSVRTFAEIAKFLAVVFVVLFVASLIYSLLSGKRPPAPPL